MTVPAGSWAVLGLVLLFLLPALKDLLSTAWFPLPSKEMGTEEAGRQHTAWKTSNQNLPGADSSLRTCGTENPELGGSHKDHPGLAQAEPLGTQTAGWQHKDKQNINTIFPVLVLHGSVVPAVI